MTDLDKPIPYHLFCCECDACLNGPVPYKLTDMGRTYPTPGDRPSRKRAAELEARHQDAKRVDYARAKARRAG